MRTVRVIDPQNSFGWEKGTQFDTDDESAKRLVARGVVKDVTAPAEVQYLENPPADDFVVTIVPDEPPEIKAKAPKSETIGKTEPSDSPNISVSEEGKSNG